MEEGQLSDDHMYIIISGKILFVKQNNPKENIEKTYVSDLNKEKQQQILQNIHPKQLRKKIDKYGTEVNSMGPGEGFGELALIQNQKLSRRQATAIIESKRAYILTLEKKDFQKIINRQQIEKENKKDFLVQSIPALEKVYGVHNLDNLCFQFKQKDFKKGTIICQQQSLGEFIYLIKNGNILVQKLIKFKHPLYMEDKQSIVTVSELNKNSYSLIGEEILFKGSDDFKKEDITYDYQVIAQSALQLYYIPRLNLIENFPKECLQGIKENFLKKEKQRQQHIKFFEQFQNDSFKENTLENQLNNKSRQNQSTNLQIMSQNAKYQANRYQALKKLQQNIKYNQLSPIINNQQNKKAVDPNIQKKINFLEFIKNTSQRFNFSENEENQSEQQYQSPQKLSKLRSQSTDKKKHIQQPKKYGQKSKIAEMNHVLQSDNKSQFIQKHSDRHLLDFQEQQKKKDIKVTKQEAIQTMHNIFSSNTNLIQNQGIGTLNLNDDKLKVLNYYNLIQKGLLKMPKNQRQTRSQTQNIQKQKFTDNINKNLVKYDNKDKNYIAYAGKSYVPLNIQHFYKQQQDLGFNKLYKNNQASINGQTQQKFIISQIKQEYIDNNRQIVQSARKEVENFQNQPYIQNKNQYNLPNNQKLQKSFFNQKNSNQQQIQKDTLSFSNTQNNTKYINQSLKQLNKIPDLSSDYSQYQNQSSSINKQSNQQQQFQNFEQNQIHIKQQQQQQYQQELENILQKTFI